MKKFLVCLQNGMSFDCYVEAESEEKAAEKLGIGFSEVVGTWFVVVNDEEHFLELHEIKEVSTPHVFDTVVYVRQQEQR